jgi:hypothetical protein
MSLDRPAIDRDALIGWVAKFLNYWEDTGMLYWPAAEIIVNQICNSLCPEKDSEQKEINHLPKPSSFFHTD